MCVYTETQARKNCYVYAKHVMCKRLYYAPEKKELLLHVGKIYGIDFRNEEIFRFTQNFCVINKTEKSESRNDGESK